MSRCGTTACAEGRRSGSRGNPSDGAIVHPGQTRDVDFASAGASGLPWSCSFDLSTKTGARASFVYTSGYNGSTVVIPAQK